MGTKVILVTGYCAAGKSTFAAQLGRALGLACFSKDTLKETADRQIWLRVFNLSF